MNKKYQVVTLEQYNSDNASNPAEDKPQLFVRISEITGSFELFFEINDRQKHAVSVIKKIQEEEIILTLVVTGKDGLDKKYVVDFK